MNKNKILKLKENKKAQGELLSEYTGYFMFFAFWVIIVMMLLYVGFAKFQSLKIDRKSTRLNSSHIPLSRMPSSA